MRKQSPLALALTVATLTAALAPIAAPAQVPQPRLTSLSRLGTAAGETVEVSLRGTDLEGVNALWFDHPGLRAFHLKGATFRVACAAGLAPGHHDVRALSPLGISNPRTFVIGDRPETVEVEPNNTPAQANPIALNSVANGEVAATDVDCFAFDGKRGQRLLIDLEGERVESRLDGTLRLLNPAGVEVAESRDAQGADPLLDVTLPADGRYVIKVHDVVYGGSPDHAYRLTLTDGPHLDAIVPAVALPGVAATFTLIGRNIGGTPAPDLAIDGNPLERRTVTWTPAGGDPDPATPAVGWLPSAALARRGSEFRLTLPSGTSNPLFVAEADAPVVVENEPNDDEAHAQRVTLPFDLSGSFGTLNDVDLYRFPAKTGDIWWIEATAERLGSPADPIFLVQRVPEKGPVLDLVTGEDTADQGGAARFGTATVDAGLRWQVPEDGTYQIAISDLYASQRGDPRLSYRLEVRPERPDFRIVLVPPSTTQADAVTVGAGGRASAYVLAWRTDGFAGPIRVEARGLPPGVRCDPITIPAGQALAPIVFEAAEDAPAVAGLVDLVGYGRVGDRKEDLRYHAGATPLGPDATHHALGGVMTWPPGNPQAPTIAPARVTRGFVLAIRGTAPLALSASPTSWVVAQGHQLNLDLNVKRRGDFTEAVAVTASDLPPNLANASVTIAKGATIATLPLFVAKTVAPGTYTLLLRGTGPFPFSKDPNAKTRPNVNLSEPSNPITIVVRPSPVNLTLNNKGGALKAGGTLQVDVTATRQNGFADAVTLSLVAPATSRLQAAPVTIAAGQTGAQLVVQAAPDSPVGAAAAVAVRSVSLVRGESVEVDEPLALTIGK